jgi:uncharacterized protein
MQAGQRHIMTRRHTHTMPVDPAVILPAGAIVLLAYVIFGISGFGSTLIAVPLLAHLFPLKFVIPLVVVLDCVGAFGMGFKLRADVNRRELVPLLPFLVVGMGIGVVLLLRLPAEILLGVLGFFVVAYGAKYMLGRESAVRLPRWMALPVGLFAGTTSTTLAVGGPIYVMYLTGRGSTPEQIRATLPVIFMFTTVTRITIFTFVGLFSREILVTAAMLLPMMVLGIFIGHRMHLNFSRNDLVRVIGGLLVLSGVSLLVRAYAV